MKNKENIVKELSTAKYSISIAVSWLTDLDLMDILIEKAKQSLIIKIVLSASDWNLLRYRQLKDLSTNNVIIYKKGAKTPSDGSFMHCKFCIIDEETVVHGSYNWTKNAVFNDENVAIDKNYEVARKFNQEFHRLMKDSVDFFSDLTEEGALRLFPELEKMESEGYNPEQGDLDLKATSTLVKAKSEIAPKTDSIEDLGLVLKHQFENGPFILDAHATIYLRECSRINIMNFWSVTIGSSNGTRIPFRIKEGLLRQSLLKNANFKILYSTLAGIPDILLTMLLRSSTGFTIHGPLKVQKSDEPSFLDTKYLELLDNGTHIAFHLNNNEPKKPYSPPSDPLYINGYETMMKIITGEMTANEFNNRFKIIDWWIK